MLQEVSLLLLKITAFYFLAINIVYGILMFLSWREIKLFNKRHKNIKQEDLPGVSFIVPAYNEETLIVETIQTYLSLENVKKEIIIINDGSHDHTMILLKNMFQLIKIDGPLYQSITRPEIRVLEAPHTGKARALNLGISYAKYDLICTMDADTIPVARGVEACLKAFAYDPKLMATGGVIQALKGKSNWLTSFQRIEYLRTFICERLGWSYLDSTLLISGAFCMLKKEAIQKIGGFNHRSIVEDFDLIVRLRRAYKGTGFKFKTLPFTTCYTQVPEKMKHLSMQRMRWQLGLAQTLFQNSSLFMHPGHKAMGLFAVPYFWLVEAFSPVLELVAYLVVPFAFYNGWLPLDMIFLYLGIGILFNLMITLWGVFLDNKSVSQKKHWSYTKSTIDTILLHFGYKQIISYWRLLALMKSFKKINTWGDKPRAEIIHNNL